MTQQLTGYRAGKFLYIYKVSVTFVSGSLPDFSMVSTIAGGCATHVNETAADSTIHSFLTKNNAVNRKSQAKHSG